MSDLAMRGMVPILNLMSPDAPALFARLRTCRLCAERFAATASAHAPRPIVRLHPDAPIVIVSQAPGRQAHLSGIPFDDASGRRLRDWMGMEEAEFFAPRTISIAPMGFCFPGNDAAGGDLPPPAICRETWHAPVMAALPGRRLTLVVGAMAQRVMPGARAMTPTVRAWRDMPAGTYPLPHPSWRNTPWLRRNPWFEAELLPHLRRDVARVLNEGVSNG